MKKHFLLNAIIACMVLFVSVHSTHAVTAPTFTTIDKICGDSINSPECTIGDFKTFFNGIILYGSVLILVVLTAYIIWRIVWGAKQLIVDGNAGAWAEAKKEAGSSIVGYIILIFLIGGGLFAITNFIGVAPWLTRILHLFISDSFVQNAYAADSLLPNALPGVTNVYDLVLTFVSLALRFIAYPVLLGLWVYTGFSYVLAQGNPEKIGKVHSWLLVATIATVSVFIVQGFLIVVTNTVKEIFQQKPAFIIDIVKQLV